MNFGKIFPLLWVLLLLQSVVNSDRTTDNGADLTEATSSQGENFAKLLFKKSSDDTLFRKISSVLYLPRGNSTNPQAEIRVLSKGTEYNANGLTGRERDARIDQLLKDPKATFFKGENMTGQVVKYDSTNSSHQGTCQDVWGVKSMRISGSCVRVFKGSHCQGVSSSLYPKPNSRSCVNFLTAELPSVASVGPCLPNEFQFAKVSLNGCKVTVTKDMSNPRQVPDTFDFSGASTYFSQSTRVSNSPTNPIDRFYMDRCRPKWIRAVISSWHPQSSSGIGRNFAIPPGLGGPTNKAYNTFLQSRNNFEEWRLITDQMESHVMQNSGKWAWTDLMFVYDSLLVTKPYGFYYYVSFVSSRGNNARVVHGFLPNE